MLEETGLDVEVGTVAGYREEFEDGRHYVILAFHVSADGVPVAGDDAAECEFVDPREALTRELTPRLPDVFRDAGLL
jgi:ADP-ribose pyrophosphatase YjhB (NUDIX family)